MSIPGFEDTPKTAAITCPRDALRHFRKGGTVELRAFEKVIGVRTKNGVVARKQLSPKHKMAITLVMNGWKYGEVAAYLGVGYQTVVNVLSDPLAKPIIEQIKDEQELSLQAMTGLALDATRDALLDNDKNMRLRGVDRFVKLIGRFDQGAKVGDITLIQNNISGIRERFVESLRELVPQTPELEGSAE